MTPYEFEDRVASMYRSLGYKVDHTKYSGDGGVDMFISKDGWTWAVECKMYDSSISAGRRDVQVLHAACVASKSNGAIFICTGRFTQNAVEYARDNRIKLISAEALEMLMRQAFEGKSEPKGKIDTVSDSHISWPRTERVRIGPNGIWCAKFSARSGAIYCLSGGSVYKVESNTRVQVIYQESGFATDMIISDDESKVLIYGGYMVAVIDLSAQSRAIETTADNQPWVDGEMDGPSKRGVYQFSSACFAAGGKLVVIGRTDLMASMEGEGLSEDRPPEAEFVFWPLGPCAPVDGREGDLEPGECRLSADPWARRHQIRSQTPEAQAAIAEARAELSEYIFAPPNFQICLDRTSRGNVLIESSCPADKARSSYGSFYSTPGLSISESQRYMFYYGIENDSKTWTDMIWDQEDNEIYSWKRTCLLIQDCQSNYIDTIRLEGGYFSAYAAGPDDKIILACFTDGRVLAWDLKMGLEIGQVRISPSSMHAIRFVGPYNVLVATETGSLYAIDCRSMTSVIKTQLNLGNPLCVDISPNGDALVSGHEDGFLRVWDLRS